MTKAKKYFKIFTRYIAILVLVFFFFVGFFAIIDYNTTCYYNEKEGVSVFYFYEDYCERKSILRSVVSCDLTSFNGSVRCETCISGWCFTNFEYKQPLQTNDYFVT